MTRSCRKREQLRQWEQMTGKLTVSQAQKILFINTLYVRKEGKETDYWLNIIADTNPSLKSRMANLIKEGQEIIKIVSTIIYDTKKNKRTLK
ncbi:MAG: hypothetical protein A3F31_02575 [Candidatus Levybacteria bacterium RIFCSPHIGHO2_12_FULL_38_12]|nr:MAG: hypothetical protein A3F31_02575 [Candidatus Levybacteria bacterium RIFCSPHIGHO2_12_FULL_38_12]OGH33635.1 MAG: hypothetical protein A3A47_02280 [Candidatus Levybacteria bacterium RIFCSPLOWO2_01_FULL_37_20]